MAANPQLVTRSYLKLADRILRVFRSPVRAFAFPTLLLPLFLALPAPPALPQGGPLILTGTSNQAGPGPGDVKINPLPFGTFVYSASFVTGQQGEIVTHLISPNGTVVFLGRTPAGREPRQIALSPSGNTLYVANSISNTVTIMPIKGGIPQSPIATVPSGGSSPFDIATPFPGGRRIEDDVTRIAIQNGIVVVNRESSDVCLLRYNGTGQPVLLDCETTGQNPHAVSFLDSGVIAVANETGQSISILKTDGTTLELKSTIPLPARPQNVVHHIPVTQFGGCIPSCPACCAALDRPGATEDSIQCFGIDSDGQPTNVTNTPAGHFLTGLAVVPNLMIAAPDFDAGLNMMIAATVNINGPGGADDRNEIRVYTIDPLNRLTLFASAQTSTFPPNFQQVYASFGTDFNPVPDELWIVTTEFQSNANLRSFRLKFPTRTQ